MTEQPFIIVQATSDHIEPVARLFDDYRIFYRQASDLEGARAYLLARMQQQESVIFLAYAPQADAAVGWGFTQLYPSFSSVGMCRIWILYDLFVVLERRRLGVGRALLVYAHRFARGTGARTVSLATAVDNHNAQALYKSLGYMRDDGFYHYDLRF